MENTRRTWPTESIKRDSLGLLETKSPSMGLTCFCTKFFVYILCLLALCFCGTSNNGRGFVFDSFVCFWDPFPPVGFPSLASVWGLLPCFIVSCFVMFGSMLFSEGKQRRNGSEGGEGMGGTGRGEERGKCGLDLLNERSIYSQLKKIILLKIWNIML